MNYVEWNSKIGGLFFGEGSSGRRVVMCVTRDTLAEVSGLPPDEALRDFVSAVLDGPEWNRIRGCTFLETKVHCCLHVDPQWGRHWAEGTRNPPWVNELQNLANHVHWSNSHYTQLNEDHPDRYPPYLAYLAAFVLAWTERDSDYNGNDYYDPLLELLGGQLRWPERPAFGRRYRFNGLEHSMNDVWKDLMRFCEAHGRAELILPDTVLRPGRYVDTPKFFGLMKASDLRNLDRLFVAMEEARLLRPDFVPPVRGFVNRVLLFGQVAAYLSNTCLNNLKSAGNSEDSSLAEAYGRLFQSKYRDFDGLPDEEDHAQMGRRGRTARLLRAMDRNGNIKFVCRLRSEAALKKLALEGETDYVFTREGIEISTRWFSDSEWFHPMDVPINDPMGELAMDCPALRIKATMSAKDFIVLHNSLYHNLARFKVEVDEVEKGRQYVLLARGTEEPALGGIRLVRMNTPCPQGLSCWSFSVPVDATSEEWLDSLPPLGEETSPKPRLNFSGFRLEPRTTRFPVGLPVRIRCSLDNVALVAAGDIGEGDLLEEDEGIWVLRAQRPGDIAFSIRSLDSQQSPEGWQDQEISIASLDEKGAGRRVFVEKLLDEAKSPPYPEALVELVGGVPDPRCGGGAKTYFATTTPKVKVVVSNIPEGKLQVFLGEEQCAAAEDGCHVLPTVAAGQRAFLQVKNGQMLLVCLPLAFSREPEIQVKCASKDRSHPVEVSNSLVATVRGDKDLLFDWEVRSSGVRVTGGQAPISSSGIWEGVLLTKVDADLETGKTFEVRFGIGGYFKESRWFKFRVSWGPSGRAEKGVLYRPSLGGFNSMENAFKGISIPGEDKGGKS